MEKDILLERYELSLNRIRELAEAVTGIEEADLPADASYYFKSVAGYLYGLLSGEDVTDSGLGGMACGNQIDTARFPEDHGRLFTGLYRELQSVELFVRTGCLSEVVIRLELFLEVYSAYVCAWQEKCELPEVESISRIFYWFAFDYADVAAEQYVKELVGEADAVCLNSSSILYDFLPLQVEDDSTEADASGGTEKWLFVPDKAYLSRKMEAFRMALEKHGVPEKERAEYCHQAKKYVAHLG